jgi:hypothetical protein
MPDKRRFRIFVTGCMPSYIQRNNCVGLIKKNFQCSGISMFNNLSYPVNQSTLGAPAKKPKDNCIALRYRESQSDENPTIFMFRFFNSLYKYKVGQTSLYRTEN